MSSANKILARIEKSLHEIWPNTWGNSDYVEEFIHGYFRNMAMDALRSTVGVEERFGCISVRYNSILQKVIDAKAQGIAQEWLTKAFQSQHMELTTSQKEVIYSAFQREFVSILKKEMKKAGKRAAREIVEKHLLAEDFDPLKVQEDMAKVAYRIATLSSLMDSNS